MKHIIFKVVKENIKNIVDHSDVEYMALSKLIEEAITQYELDEHNAYETRFLLGLRDSQASAFQEDLNERKARQ